MICVTPSLAFLPFKAHKDFEQAKLPVFVNFPVLIASKCKFYDIEQELLKMSKRVKESNNSSLNPNPPKSWMCHVCCSPI